MVEIHGKMLGKDDVSKDGQQHPKNEAEMTVAISAVAVVVDNKNIKEAVAHRQGE